MNVFKTATQKLSSLQISEAQVQKTPMFEVLTQIGTET
jgi:hypothetical protein